VAGSPASYGPNLRAPAVYLLLFKHVPVERAAALIADVTGKSVSTGWVASLRHYHQGVKVGLARHPRAEGRKQSPARNLLERLRDRVREVLRFANNTGERAFRPVKTQVKISGCRQSSWTPDQRISRSIINQAQSS
jgi:hypothetical protein